MEFRILAIGDIYGAAGVSFIERKLWGIRSLYGADFVVANGENAALTGITPTDARTLFSAGVDVITLGNHALRKREIIQYLDDEANILRPANWSSSAPGHGYTAYNTPKLRVGVINLSGRVDMDTLCDDPFRTADAIIGKLAAEADIIAVDFHAEATSEKNALGYYLDGRVAAVFGTHTHVQTADERVLPQGTGYITDLGMTGPVNSVIGASPARSIAFFRGDYTQGFDAAEGPAALHAALFTIDDAGRTMDVTRVRIE